MQYGYLNETLKNGVNWKSLFLYIVKSFVCVYQYKSYPVSILIIMRKRNIQPIASEQELLLLLPNHLWD